jgi:hypothetical protein
VSGFLNLLFRQLSESLSFGKLTRDDVKTKKCKNCLRRCGLDWIKCPHCGFTNFHFSES